MPIPEKQYLLVFYGRWAHSLRHLQILTSTLTRKRKIRKLAIILWHFLCISLFNWRKLNNFNCWHHVQKIEVIINWKIKIEAISAKLEPIYERKGNKVSIITFNVKNVKKFKETFSKFWRRFQKHWNNLQACWSYGYLRTKSRQAIKHKTRRNCLKGKYFVKIEFSLSV